MPQLRDCVALDTRGFASAAAGSGWWEPARLRALAGSEKALGYARGPEKHAPEWAFLAADTTAPPFRAARRSVVVLGSGTVVAFDFVAPAAGGCRQFVAANGAAEIGGNTFRAGGLHHTVFVPGAGEPILEAAPGGVLVTPPKRRDEALFLHVAQPGAALPPQLVWTIDLAGVRLGDRVIAFHGGSRMGQEPVFFDVDEGAVGMKFLLTGLAPGAWDIWWKGWLEHPDAWVAPEASTLYFEGPPGGYYFRRRSGV